MSSMNLTRSTAATIAFVAALIVAPTLSRAGLPDICRDRVFAKSMLHAVNGYWQENGFRRRVFDVENLYTMKYTQHPLLVECHGIFKTASNEDLPGVFSVKNNVAGDPIFLWQQDPSPEEMARLLMSQDRGTR